MLPELSCFLRLKNMFSETHKIEHYWYFYIQFQNGSGQGWLPSQRKLGHLFIGLRPENCYEPWLWKYGYYTIYVYPYFFLITIQKVRSDWRNGWTFSDPHAVCCRSTPCLLSGGWWHCNVECHKIYLRCWGMFRMIVFSTNTGGFRRWSLSLLLYH